MASRSGKYNLLLVKNSTPVPIFGFVYTLWTFAFALLSIFGENEKSVQLFMFWTCLETCGLKFKCVLDSPFVGNWKRIKMYLCRIFLIFCKFGCVFFLENPDTKIQANKKLSIFELCQNVQC